MNNRIWHRIVTAISVVVALLLFWGARSGRLGERAEEFATEYLIAAICILALRAFLTERGVRRPRYTFEQRKK